jgi:hypothetical protein
MPNYFSADSYKVRRGLGKNIAILVKELPELRLLFWAHFGSDAHSSIWYSGVDCHSIEITFGFNWFFELC